MWSYYISKALILSTILYILGWTLKTYRTEKHNYVVNMHKAMTLTMATEIFTKDLYASVDRNLIFTEAMKSVFAHQQSGFSVEDKSKPSVINTLLQRNPLESGA